MIPFRQSGKTLPDLNYVCRHIRRLMPLLSQSMKPRARADLQSMMAWAGGPRIAQANAPLNILMRAASKNMHSNGYHHPWHTMTVMMMAGILGRLAGLDDSNRSTLLCFALIHDLDHRGRFMTHRIFDEEIRSATIAARRLYGQQCATGTAKRQMITAIKATSFSADHIGEGDAVTALLKDADLLGSILFPDDDVLKLTKGLKRETSSPIPSREMLAEFLEMATDKGFAHPITEMMAAVVRGKRKHMRYISPLSGLNEGSL